MPARLGKAWPARPGRDLSRARSRKRFRAISYRHRPRFSVEDAARAPGNAETAAGRMDAARARTGLVKRRRSVQRELVADHFISRQKTAPLA